jgi:general secretion pathway protein G
MAPVIQSPTFSFLVFLAIIVLFTVGAMMARRGFWPGRKGYEPHCAECDCVLVGIQSEHCPECGVFLSPEKYACGSHQRRPMLGSIGASLILLGAAMTFALSQLSTSMPDGFYSAMFAGIIFLSVWVAVIWTGAVMTRRGFVLHREGDLPHCPKCEYLLIGIQSERCPECGTAVSSGNIAYGEPRRRVGVGLMGVCIFLMGLSAPIVVPKFTGGIGESRITVADTDISNLKVALDAFEIDNGRFPTTGEGLNALVSPPPGLPNWTRAYLLQVPIDPWGHPYIYRCPGTNGKDFDLISGGPDGIVGTADDLTN